MALPCHPPKSLVVIINESVPSVKITSCKIMLVNIFATSRYHYERLALQLARFTLLGKWVTALPKSKIPFALKQNTISYSFPLYLHLATSRYLSSYPRVPKYFEHMSNLLFDRKACSIVEKIQEGPIIGLSHNILKAGLTVQKSGLSFFCDVPIAHPQYLNQLLSNEYAQLGLPFAEINARQVEQEMQAHYYSNHIICPSSFVKDTLVESGVPTNKISIVPYGIAPVSSRAGKNLNDKQFSTDSFSILFVGQLSTRKGLHYLLEAFNNFKHPHKHLILAGPILFETKQILSGYCLDNVKVLGSCSKSELDYYYSNADVFVLPSLAEGLALVIGEAVSYGLPIIFTRETGADDIISDGVEGLKVISKSSISICDAFQRLASDCELKHKLSELCFLKAKSLTGWNTYGEMIVKCINSLP